MGLWTELCPSPFMCWGSNPPWDILGGGAFRGRLGHEGGLSRWDNLPYEKRHQQPSLLPSPSSPGSLTLPCPMWRHSKKQSFLQARKRAFTSNLTLRAPWLWTFQHPELWERNACGLSCPLWEFCYSSLSWTIHTSLIAFPQCSRGAGDQKQAPQQQEPLSCSHFFLLRGSTWPGTQ
jgi:hypothetical protein